jgi:hypothetical protein
MISNFRSNERRKIYEREEENRKLRNPYEILLSKYTGNNFGVPGVDTTVVVK